MLCVADYGQVHSSIPDNTDKKRVGIGLSGSLEELPVPAGSTQPVGGVQTRPAQSEQSAAGDENRKGELIIAPMPISSEALGTGLAPVVAYVFFPSAKDRVSQPSTLAVAGLYTTTKTYGFGFGGTFNLAEDRYRFTFLTGAARARYEFFGIGSSAGAEGGAIWLSQHRHAVFVQGLR